MQYIPIMDDLAKLMDEAYSANLEGDYTAGPEPDPLLLDSMIAYMNEFDFLPNSYLNRDGTLNDSASESARRGEITFNRPFAQMNNMSCASCHIPNNNFLDRRNHDIGTIGGSSQYSLDRTMDTPTLLSAAYTAPYMHDGSLATLKDVVDWFDSEHKLELVNEEKIDLVAYLETVGGGIESYEDTLYTLEMPGTKNLGFVTPLLWQVLQLICND